MSARRWVVAALHPKRQTKAFLGTRVRLTASGLHQGLQGRARSPFGRITHVYGLTPEYIGVRRDGIKRAEQYAADFWEAIV